MKKRVVYRLKGGFIAVLLVNSAAAAPQTIAEKKPAPVNYTLSMPAFSIIHRAIDEMVPRFDDQKNAAMMQLICYAADPASSLSMQEILAAQNIEIDKTKPSNQTRALLNAGTKADLRRACVAWIVSTSSDVVDTMTWGKARSQEQQSTDSDSHPEIASAAERLAVAQANAELFGFIVFNLQDGMPRSPAEYGNEIAKLISAYGVRYFQQINALQARTRPYQYSVSVIGHDSFIISDPHGAVYEQKGHQFSLSVDDILWLGKGTILGQVSFLPVSITDD